MSCHKLCNNCIINTASCLFQFLTLYSNLTPISIGLSVLNFKNNQFDTQLTHNTIAMSVEPDTAPIWVEPIPDQNREQSEYLQPQAQPSSNANNSQSIVSIFSLKFYAQYFDIDTRDVLRRTILALNPFTPGQVFLFHTDENPDPSQPDLYGPFWITSSVIFFLFFASSVTGLIISSLITQKPFEYRFDLLTGAASLLYSYTFIWPPILWFVSRYQGLLTQQPNASMVSFVSLYGYSNIIWIPVAILAVTPLDGLLPKFTDLFRWFVVLLGYAFSAVFLAKNLKAIYLPRDTAGVTVDKTPGGILLSVVLLLHVAVAIAIKYLFFNSKVSTVKN